MNIIVDPRLGLVFCSLFFWPGGAILEGPHVVSWMVVGGIMLVVWRTNEVDTWQEDAKEKPQAVARERVAAGEGGAFAAVLEARGV